jgi:hypothetical protein
MALGRRSAIFRLDADGAVGQLLRADERRLFDAQDLPAARDEQQSENMVYAHRHHRYQLQIPEMQMLLMQSNGDMHM